MFEVSIGRGLIYVNKCTQVTYNGPLCAAPDRFAKENKVLPFISLSMCVCVCVCVCLSVTVLEYVNIQV